MSNIRVTYSGLIAFIIAIISVLTGIVFILIVTRRLPPEDFAIWTIIGSLLGYFLVVEPIISYWCTRQIARGQLVGRTALFSSSALSLGFIPIYLILALIVSQISNEHLNSLILASILLPLIFVSQTLMGINLGHKPHATSISILAFEGFKIPSGLVLVYFLSMGIDGAIFATMVAYLGKIFIQLYYARPKIQDKFNLSIVIDWFKLGWLPIYSKIAHFIWTLDVVLYPIIVGSLTGVAFYGVSLAVASIVAHSGMISQALYPKLLAKRDQNFVKQNFNHLLYFAIPILGIIIIFAKPALFMLNPIYKDASLVVIILAFRSILYVITSMFYNVLQGLETVDIEKNPKFFKFIHSKLFIVPTLTNIHHGVYITVLVVSLLFLVQYDLTELQLITYWASLTLILQIPFLIYALKLVRKEITLQFSISRISKYLLATIIFSLVYFLTSDFIIVYKESIFEFLPGMILELMICLSIYLSLTYLLDKKTRTLFKTIMKELKVG